MSLARILTSHNEESSVEIGKSSGEIGKTSVEPISTEADKIIKALETISEELHCIKSMMCEEHELLIHSETFNHSDSKIPYYKGR